MDVSMTKSRAYLELMKPRIVFMVLVTAAIGFFLGEQRAGLSMPLFVFLVGTAMTSGGASVLNQYLERDSDSKMRRTSRRPIPSGTVTPAEALGLGTLLVLSGTVLLVSEINLLTGFLALLTAFLYVLVYTPLKRVTWLNTFIGAVPGALPPMGGWAAATGELGAGAWILFAILFIWQHPHFYAIAWMYKEDYRRGGYKMLPVVEPDGQSTFRQIVIYSVLLLPASILPYSIGMSGRIYAIGVIAMGLSTLAIGLMLARSGSVADARRLLRATVLYLPAWLVLIVVDSGF